MPDPFISPPGDGSRRFGEKYNRELIDVAKTSSQAETHSLSHEATGSESASQLGPSAMQALQEEIAALRGILSTGPVVRIEHSQYSASDVLPQYEESHSGESAIAAIKWASQSPRGNPDTGSGIRYVPATRGGRPLNEQPVFLPIFVNKTLWIIDLRGHSGRGETRTMTPRYNRHHLLHVYTISSWT